jgi:hypothetical protein
MPETLEDVEREIEELKKKIKKVETALETCVAEEKATLNALLVSYNGQLLLLREKEKELRLIEGAAPGPEDIRRRLEALEQRVIIGQDERLYFFCRLMPPSSGKHTVAATTIWDLYDACVVCGMKKGINSKGQSTVTLAHIVAGSKKVRYTPFSTPRYVDDLDVSSNRNFLPLCGTDGEPESCHNEFDKYSLTFLYDPFLKTYKVLCLNKAWSKYDACNGKTLSLKHEPYRRLLAWRTRHCFQINAFLLNGRPDVDALIRAVNFSEESHSMAGKESAASASASSSDVTKASGTVDHSL